MKLRFFTSSFAGLAMLAAMGGYAAAQTTSQAVPATTQNTQNMQLVSANAQLVKTLNSKSASQGQTVTAKLTSNVKAADGTKLDKGTVLIGKVEQVQKSGGSGPATLSLVFDQARLKNGQTVPVKTTLLGAYPANAGDEWVDSGASGTLMPVQPHTIPDTQKVDQEPGMLRHVALRSAVQSDVSGVFTNQNGNINLKRGTRLQIAIAPQTTAAGQGS